jgi:hypothetical protein
MQHSPKTARLSRLVLGLLCVMLMVPLSIYAYNGLSMRFSGDDYCYAGVLKMHGFFETQWFSYLHSIFYNGNRYSLTFFSSLVGLFPPAANGALPGLAIILFVIGITWMLRAGAGLFERPDEKPLDPLVFVFFAECLVFFTFNQAANLDQSLFWRSGMLPYLAPLIANTYLAGFIISNFQKPRSQGWLLAGCFLIAVLAGGFSETGAALQGAFLGLAFFGALTNLQKGSPSARRLFGMVITSLAGTLIAILLLYFSPSNQSRLSAFPASPGLLKFGSILINSMEIFLYISIKKQIIPDVLLILFFFLAGLFSYRMIPRRSPNFLKRWFMAEILIGIGGAVLLAATMLPFAYLQQSYPYERALITSRFVFVLCEGAGSWLAGCAFFGSLIKESPGSAHPFISNRTILGIVSVASLIFVLIGIYPLQAARNELSQTSHVQKWAYFWDARDKAIQEAVLEHRNSVKVVAIDHVISGVADLSPDPAQWYNGCAALYYGVTAISASLPGWDQ